MKKANKTPFEAPVDFLIVTALELELDAVLSQLDEPVEFYPRNMLRASYCAIIPVDGGGRYRVVAMSVFGMGNTEAALATSEMIKLWEPGTIIMVGIAAGMPKKKNIKLGDVLISEYIFDYEPAKLTSVGTEHRSRQLPVDQALWHRAHAYKRSDWHSRVRARRPNLEGSDQAIDVHFGPLASGEKVIADEAVMHELLERCPKLIGAEMESSGVARAALQQVNPSRFIAIRSVSDLGDKNKADGWQPYAAAVAAAFAIGFLYYGPLEPLSTTVRSAKDKPRTRLLIAQSMRQIAPAEVLPPLQNGGGLKVEAVSIDLTDLVSQGELRDPQGAVDRLLAPDGQFMGALISRKPAELAFCGHVHIPLAVLMGHTVTDRRSVRLLDYDPRSGAENWLWPGAGEAFEPLRRADLEVGDTANGHNEVIIRVAVSYPASQEAARAVVPQATREIELAHPHQERSIVRSEEQAREYASSIRAALDSLESLSPRVSRVHLFYAGPVALAFRIGQQISPTMHPPVTVWNYRAGRYEWGIDLEATRDGTAAIVWGEKAVVEGKIHKGELQ
jgi:nucleoside phosphorylase